MQEEQRQLQLSLESNSPGAARLLMFKLTDRPEGDVTTIGKLAFHLSHIHVHGRFVYAVAVGTAEEIYEDVLSFLREQFNVAFVSLMPVGTIWDYYNMQLLQQCMSSLSKGYLLSCTRLVNDYFSLVDSSMYTDQELERVIVASSLFTNCGDGEAVKNALRAIELCRGGDDAVSRCSWEAENCSVKKCEGSKVLWRVMSHLICRERLSIK